MRNFLCVVILLSGCKDSKLVSVTECGAPCGSDIGECSSGYYVCDDDNNVVGCVGGVGPRQETCDGLDNDCNGYIDDLVEQCATQCGTGYRRCILGEWLECSARKPAQEECNGIDDDCDWKIDEPEDVPVQLCSSNGINNVGACRPGVTRCEHGKTICIGEILPSDEICDGLDNDCDGNIDNGVSSNINVLFIVDESGSMSVVFNNVVSAIQMVVNTYAQNPKIRWSYVAIGTSTPNIKYDAVDMVTNGFTTAQIFLSTLKSRNGGSGSGAEPSMDALYMACHGMVGWELGANKIAVMFTDEEPQSYMFNLTNVNQLGCTGDVQIFIFFNKQYPWYTYSSIASLHDIYAPPTEISSIITDTIIDSMCK
jgi:hypothetical protein